MEKKNKKKFYDEIWDLFVSLKFAIILLITLVLFSFLAIFLQEKFPPDYPPQYWQTKMSPQKFNLFNMLGFFNPYFSFWYLVILLLLSLNVLICTLSRIKPIWALMTKKTFKKNQSVIKQSDVSSVITLKKEYKTIENDIKQIFKRRFFRVFTEGTKDAPVFYFTKGGWGRLGFFGTHIGLLLILSGGIIGNRYGFKVMQFGEPGTVFNAPRREFQVRVDDFELVMNEKGQIKDYLSTLTVLENNQEVLTKIVEVNHPLIYRGLNFYQSEYGLSPGKIESAVLRITYPDSSGYQKVVTIKTNERVSIEYDDLYIKATEFIPHFAMGENNQVYSASNNPVNPALRIEVYKNEELINYNWVFKNYPDMQHMRKIPVNIQFMNYDGIYQTGIQITSNPGSPFLLIGFLIMSIGVCIALFVSHRRLWGLIEKNERGKTQLIFGGSSNKNKIGLEAEIKKIRKEISNL